LEADRSPAATRSISGSNNNMSRLYSGAKRAVSVSIFACGQYDEYICIHLVTLRQCFKVIPYRLYIYEAGKYDESIVINIINGIAVNAVTTSS